MTNTTRRGFLRGAMGAAAGAVAAPLIVPSRVLGADGHTAPSARLALGLVGMGKMCFGHLGGLLGRGDVHVAAVCDVESLRLEKCRLRSDEAYANRTGEPGYTACAAYRDFRELVARPDLDAVLVATPTHWHALVSVAAMEAGKDVYCEKPLSLTIAEGRAIVEAARRYQRIFQTGSQQRSDYRFRFACELVRNGRIGRIERVHVGVGGPPRLCCLPAQPVPPSLDWDLWLGPAPVRPYHHTLCPLDNYEMWPDWRSYWDFCGGGMTDMGAHHFDIVQWALGTDDTGPVDILPPEASPRKLLTFRYANGVLVHHGGNSPRASIEFHGSEGYVGVDRGVLVAEPASLLRETWGPGDVHLYESQDHMSNWLDCIRSRRPTICSAAVGHRSVSLCHLGNLAYRLKRPLAWDPERERFANDPLADRLLWRPMRAPWVL
jgi:predicted dehydrogenase